MSETVASALISVLPQLIIVLVGTTFLAVYRRPIGEFVSRRVTTVSGLGFSIGLSAEAVEKAVADKTPGSTLAGPSVAASIAGDQVTKRWERLSPHLAGRTILWVDDHLDANTVERRLLRSMALFVEPTLTNEDGLRVLRDPEETISLVISDIGRDSGPNGLDLLTAIQALPSPPPVIFYVSNMDPGRPAPPGSFGITNRPDQLLNLVMDALDRAAPLNR